MNCQLCQKESDAYRGDKLSHDMRIQVESHLKTCVTCSEIYRVIAISDKVFNHEKEMQANPFLATRIMARIGSPEFDKDKNIPVYTWILKPALITLSMAAAIFLGIVVGNLSRPTDMNEVLPLELALIDDAAIESVDILSNE